MYIRLKGTEYMNTKITAWINEKGGVGKTTCSVCVGAELAKRGKKVLIVDLDKQNDATAFLDVEPSGVLSDIYAGTRNVADEAIKTNFDNLWIVPGYWVEQKPSPMALKKNLGDINQFDHVFLDCPPNQQNTLITAFLASTHVVAVIRADFFSSKNLGTLQREFVTVKKAANSDTIFAGVLVNIAKTNTKLHKKNWSNLKNALKNLLFDSFIRDTTKVVEAPSFGEPVCYYAPGSAADIDFQNVTDEFERRVK